MSQSWNNSKQNAFMILHLSMISQVLFHCNALVDLRNFIALQCKFNIRFIHLITSYPLIKVSPLHTFFVFLAHFLLFIGASTHQCVHLCHSKSCCVACDNKWPHSKGIRHLVWLHKKYPKHIVEYTKINFYCILAWNKPIVNALA